MWRSRGYLPHFDSAHVIQHVAFHLADSLPADAITRLDLAARDAPIDQQAAVRRQQIDDWIDAGHGNCILGTSAAAQIVQNALLFFDGTRYRLFAWVVMPNHVHALVQMLPGWPLSHTVASWKSFTGRRLSALLRDSDTHVSPGRVWHREYWDRYARDEQHFLALKHYIHDNPVKAGLARCPDEWLWSSARLESDTGE